MRRIALGCGTFAIGACSLFVNLDGLSSSSDAGLDATMMESGMPTDAGSDSPPVRTCDATFCDDFDDDAALGARWDGIGSNLDAGTLVRDMSDFQSPPSSLLVLVNKGVPPPGEISLYKSFAVKSRLIVRFDMKIEQLNSGGDELDPLIVTFDPVPSGFDDYLILVSSYANNTDPVTLEVWAPLSEGGAIDRTTPIPMSFGMWHNVVFDANFESNVLSASIDGAPPITLPMDMQTPSTVKLRLGCGYLSNANGGDARIRFDNVQVFAYP
jgi:hypothetical protein